MSQLGSDTQTRKQVQPQAIGGAPSSATVQRQEDHLSRHALSEKIQRSDDED